MTTRTLWQKLKSTKVWAMIAGVVIAALLVCGASADSVIGAIKAVAGMITAICAVSTYIDTEGRIDQAAVGKIEDAVNAGKTAWDSIGEVYNELDWPVADPDHWPYVTADDIADSYWDEDPGDDDLEPELPVEDTPQEEI